MFRATRRKRPTVGYRPAAGQIEPDFYDSEQTMLLQAEDERRAELEPWYPPTTPAELWEMATRGTVTFEQRIACLYELVDAEDPELPLFLVNQLQRKDLRRDEQSALVLAAERTQVFDNAMRASLKDSLLRHGVALRDLGEEEGPLWAAIRRYASLVPLSEVDGLLEFLRPEDADATKQAALHGIQHIFEVEPPDDSASISRLRERVSALALEYLTSGRADSPEGSSLALNVFCAAASLGDMNLSTLTERLIALGRARLASRARLFLHTLVQARELGVGGRDDPEHHMLLESIRRIDNNAETASSATGALP